MLKYVAAFLPRAVYTSGKSSSAAGLTASVVKVTFYAHCESDAHLILLKLAFQADTCYMAACSCRCALSGSAGYVCKLHANQALKATMMPCISQVHQLVLVDRLFANASKTCSSGAKLPPVDFNIQACMSYDHCLPVLMLVLDRAPQAYCSQAIVNVIVSLSCLISFAAAVLQAHGSRRPALTLSCSSYMAIKLW